MLPSLPFSVAWFGVVIAVAQITALVIHVRLRYPSAPKRVPSGVRLDGRPGPLRPKAWLWIPPAIFVTVVAILVGVMLAEPIPDESRTTLLLVFLVIAEVAWFAQWMTDRQIEMARKMTYRIAPARLLLAFLPIAATIAVTLAVAIAQSY